MIKRIPFTEWTPDAGSVATNGFPGLTSAVPTETGYGHTKHYSQAGVNADISSTSTEQVLSAIACRDSSGLAIGFIGTDSKIIEFATTGTDVSATGGYSSGTIGAGGRWEFVQWGDEVIATNYADDIQVRDIASVGVAFSALSTATGTPKAKTITTSRNFVVVGNTYDATDGTSPNRVRWSALGDATDWVVSQTTQSDYQDLISADGPVQRVFGGEYCVVLQERAITRMTYVGSPAVWQFDKVSVGIGPYRGEACAQIDNRIFFHSDAGFFMLVNGVELVSIGEGRVNSEFRVGQSLSDKDYVHCGIDPLSKRVYWRVPGEASEFFVYDYAMDKWGKDSVYPGSGSYSSLYCGPPVVIALPESTVESFAFPARYVISGNTLIAFLYNNVSALVNSDDLAEIESPLIELAPGRNALVKNITVGWDRRGYSEAAFTANQAVLNVDVISYRTPDGTENGSTASFSATATYITPHIKNRVSLRKNGRYHKFKIGWNSVNSLLKTTHGDTVSYIDVEFVPTHWR